MKTKILLILVAVSCLFICPNMAVSYSEQDSDTGAVSGNLISTRIEGMSLDLSGGDGVMGIDEGGDNVLRLDIDRVSRLGLRNNFDIQVFRLDKSISDEEILKARDVYDAVLDVSYEYEEDQLKRASTLLGTRNMSVSEDVSLTKQLPSGTVLSLSGSHSRDASDSTVSTNNPAHELSAGISVTQPLGKNAWGLIDNNDVKITGLDVENTGYTSADKIETELGNIQKAYWNMVLVNHEINLARKLLKSAEELYTTNKRNFDIGMVEAPEFYASEANMKEKEQAVVLAKNRLNGALNAVRFRLNLDRATVIVAEEDFGVQGVEPDFEILVKTALAKRRDYKRARNSIKRQDLSLEMKKNSLWPQIDLTASFTRNGLNKRLSDSISEIASEEYPEYIVGVVFSFPLGNSAARAEYSQKELEKAKALVGLKKTECLILVQTHDAFVNLQSMNNSAKLLKEVMELQYKKYLGEEERFNKGRSDTDRFIRYQNDYFNAELAFLRSLYSYQEAVIDLKLAANVLLEEAVE